MIREVGICVSKIIKYSNSALKVATEEKKNVEENEIENEKK